MEDRLGKKAASKSGGTTEYISVFFARQQLGEDAVAGGLGVIFLYLLGSTQTPHFTKITEAWQRCTSDVLGNF